MKYFIYTFVLMFNLFLSAQEIKFEKPDYKKIEKAIKVKNSEYYYEVLMKRFNEGDSTLSLEQKKHLYYGFRYHNNYATTYHSDSSEKLREISNKEKLEESDYEKIITYSDDILKENPFDLNVLDGLLFVYDYKKDEVNFNKRLNQLKIIIDSILSSGDGVEKKSAIFVINVSHEYFILNAIGLQYGGSQSLVDGNYDYLTVAENEFKIKGLYFDISPSLEQLNKMFKD